MNEQLAFGQLNEKLYVILLRASNMTLVIRKFELPRTRLHLRFYVQKHKLVKFPNNKIRLIQDKIYILRCLKVKVLFTISVGSIARIKEKSIITWPISSPSRLVNNPCLQAIPIPV